MIRVSVLILKKSNTSYGECVLYVIAFNLTPFLSSIFAPPPPFFPTLPH